MKKSLPGDIKARLSSIVDAAERQASAPRVVDNGTEAEKPRPTRPKTREESFKDLDAWLEEANAGMPDENLARAANVSMTAVLEWRRARGVKRLRGHLRRREKELWAVDAFGDHYDAELHAVSSTLRGMWDLPEYMLRQPLNYDLLCRYLYFLHIELGCTPDALAEAFGIKERDVEMAIAVEVSHLSRVSVPCKTCGQSTDPAYGPYCSERCKVTK
jgi:hypothetical protein